LVPVPSQNFIPLGFGNPPSQKVYCRLLSGTRRKGKVVVKEMNARKREKYEPKRIFLETLTGYIEAARVKTLDQW